MLVLSHAHGADLTRALRLGAVEQDHVTVLDAIGHGVTAHTQSELIC